MSCVSVYQYGYSGRPLSPRQAQVYAQVLNAVFDTLADAAIDSNAVITNDGSGVLSQEHQAIELDGDAALMQDPTRLTAQQQQEQRTAEAASAASELLSAAPGSNGNSELLERAKAAGQVGRCFCVACVSWLSCMRACMYHPHMMTLVLWCSCMQATTAGSEVAVMQAT